MVVTAMTPAAMPRAPMIVTAVPMTAMRVGCGRVTAMVMLTMSTVIVVAVSWARGFLPGSWPGVVSMRAGPAVPRVVHGTEDKADW